MDAIKSKPCLSGERGVMEVKLGDEKMEDEEQGQRKEEMDEKEEEEGEEEEGGKDEEKEIDEKEEEEGEEEGGKEDEEKKEKMEKIKEYCNEGEDGEQVTEDDSHNDYDEEKHTNEWEEKVNFNGNTQQAVKEREEVLVVERVGQVKGKGKNEIKEREKANERDGNKIKERGEGLKEREEEDAKERDVVEGGDKEVRKREEEVEEREKQEEEDFGDCDVDDEEIGGIRAGDESDLDCMKEAISTNNTDNQLIIIDNPNVLSQKEEYCDGANMERTLYPNISINDEIHKPFRHDHEEQSSAPFERNPNPSYSYLELEGGLAIGMPKASQQDELNNINVMEERYEHGVEIPHSNVNTTDLDHTPANCPDGSGYNKPTIDSAACSNLEVEIGIRGEDENDECMMTIVDENYSDAKIEATNQMETIDFSIDSYRDRIYYDDDKLSGQSENDKRSDVFENNINVIDKESETEIFSEKADLNSKITPAAIFDEKEGTMFQGELNRNDIEIHNKNEAINYMSDVSEDSYIETKYYSKDSNDGDGCLENVDSFALKVMEENTMDITSDINVKDNGSKSEYGNNSIENVEGNDNSNNNDIDMNESSEQNIMYGIGQDDESTDVDTHITNKPCCFDQNVDDILSCDGSLPDEEYQYSHPDFVNVGQDTIYSCNVSIDGKDVFNRINSSGDSIEKNITDDEEIYLCNTYLFCNLERNGHVIENVDDSFTEPVVVTHQQCTSHTGEFSEDDQQAVISQRDRDVEIGEVKNCIKTMEIEPNSKRRNQYNHTDDRYSKCMLQNVNHQIITLPLESPPVDLAYSETTNQTHHLTDIEDDNDKEGMTVMDDYKNNTNRHVFGYGQPSAGGQYLDGGKKGDRGFNNAGHNDTNPSLKFSSSPEFSFPVDGINDFLSCTQQGSDSECTEQNAIDIETCSSIVLGDGRSNDENYNNISTKVDSAWTEDCTYKEPPIITAEFLKDPVNIAINEINDDNNRLATAMPRIESGEIVHTQEELLPSGDNSSQDNRISDNISHVQFPHQGIDCDSKSFCQSPRLSVSTINNARHSSGNEIDLNFSISTTNPTWDFDVLRRQTNDTNQNGAIMTTYAMGDKEYRLSNADRIRTDGVVESNGVEESMLDQLFYACDGDNTGKVRVSDIIEYLGTIMGTSLENDDTINGLIEVLDPDNVNAEIDMAAYREGLHQWITAINKTSSQLQDNPNPFLDYSLADHTGESLHQSDELVDEVVIYQAASGTDDDRIILSSQLLNMQLEVQNLNQDKSEAHRLIESRDEELSRLTREMVEQETKYKRLQGVVSAFSKTEEEKAELERQLCSCQENYDTALDRNKQLEQEKSLLHVQLSRYKKQVSSLTAGFSACRYEKECLETSLLETKERLCRHKETISGLEIQLSEKDDTVYETRLSLERNSLQLQNLEGRNRELESQLAEAQAELASIQTVHAQPNDSNGNTDNCVLGLKKLRQWIEEDVEQTSEERTTAPQHSSSIKNELKDLLSDRNVEKSWPLSEKEIVDVVCVDGDQTKDVTDGGDSSQRLSNYRDGDAPCCNISNDRLRWMVNLMRDLKGENNTYRLVLSAMLSKKNLHYTDLIETRALSSSESESHSHSSSRGFCTYRQEDTPTSKTQPRCGQENGNFTPTSSACSVDVSSILQENTRLREDITNLRRYNVDLAEKYHLTEVQVQNLEEQIDETKVAWRREKQRCADLEEALNDSTLSRQLDLRDIWRLVHKDVEVETQHYTDDNYGFDSKSVETLKNNLTESITALRNFKRNALKLSIPNTEELSTNLHHHHLCNDNRCCCCSIQSNSTSPLIEALSIDAFNGNFLPSNNSNSPHTPDNGLHQRPCHNDNYSHQNCWAELEHRSASSCPSLNTDNYNKKQCQCHAKTKINNNCQHIQSGSTQCLDGATYSLSSNTNCVNHHDGNDHQNLDVPNPIWTNKDINQYCEYIHNHPVDNKPSMNKPTYDYYRDYNNINMSHTKDSTGNDKTQTSPGSPQQLTTSLSNSIAITSKSHTSAVKPATLTSKSHNGDPHPSRLSDKTKSSRISENTKSHSSIGFIPIHKEPITNTCQHKHDLIRKPRANGKYTRKGAPSDIAGSGYKGVQYSNEKGNNDHDPIVLLVTSTNRHGNDGNGNITFRKAPEQTNSIYTSDEMPRETSVEREGVQSVFQCVQHPTSQRAHETTTNNTNTSVEMLGGETRMESEIVQSVLPSVQSTHQIPGTKIVQFPFANRPSSLSWGTASSAPTQKTIQHEYRILSSSSTDFHVVSSASSSSSSPCASSSSSSLSSSSYTPVDPVNLPDTISRIQQHTASWHNRTLIDEDGPLSHIHLFGVPDSIENWDLSPGAGHDTPTLTGDEYQLCPSRKVKVEEHYEKENHSTQVDLERIYAGQGATMDSKLSNINGRNSPNKANKESSKDSKDTNANPGVTNVNSNNNNIHNNTSSPTNNNNSNKGRRSGRSIINPSTSSSGSKSQKQQPPTTNHPSSSSSSSSSSSLSFPDMASLPALPSATSPPSSTSAPSRIPIHGDKRTTTTTTTATTTDANTNSDDTNMLPSQGTANTTKPPFTHSRTPPSSPSSTSAPIPSSFSNSHHSPPASHTSDAPPQTTIDSSGCLPLSQDVSSCPSSSTSLNPPNTGQPGETTAVTTPLPNKPSSLPVSIAISPCPDDESSGGDGEQQSRAKTMLVPSSPPSSRHALAGHQGVEPLPPGRLARIRQNHLAIRRKEQMKNQKMKLPEVSENSELELSEHGTSLSLEQPHRLHSPSNTLPVPNNVSGGTLEENDTESQYAHQENEVNGPDSGSVITPSLRDSLLDSLGLMTKGPAHDASKTSPLEDLSEKEIENKFVSLSLAINTDKITVDQRVCVQERARDLAEQNVDRELQGLGEAVEALNHSIRDPEVRDIVHKIRRHIQVLEQSAARVSSRAEVYGAVQQERRLCRAIELMVQYTENLRRAREREESDVQEARKIINERSLGIPDFDSPSRRSMSVCGANALGRPMRRRSEVVLPKVLGGIGSPSLTQTSSMENICRLPEREPPEDGGEDARSRFQSAVASTSMKNAITNTLKRASLERLNSTSSSSSSTAASPRLSAGLQTPSSLLVPSSNPLVEEIKANGAAARDRDRISESSLESKGDGKVEENAFQKGYEQGVKAHLSQEMRELRDQQTSLSDAIDEVVDTVTEAQRLDLESLERPTRVKRAMTAIQTLVTFLMEYDYRSNTDMIRYIVGGLLVVLSILVIYFIPSTFLSLHHFSTPPQ